MDIHQSFAHNRYIKINDSSLLSNAINPLPVSNPSEVHPIDRLFLALEIQNFPRVFECLFFLFCEVSMKRFLNRIILKIHHFFISKKRSSFISESEIFEYIIGRITE